MCACDHCEISEKCAAWQADLIHHIMPYYGACDFESLDEYESWLKQVV